MGRESEWLLVHSTDQNKTRRGRRRSQDQEEQAIAGLRAKGCTHTLISS